MTLHTASEIISLARNLEKASAKFYADIASTNQRDNGTFIDFSRANIKNIKQIERSYYGAASDAMESTFAFNIEEKDYDLASGVSGTDYAEILNRSIKIEKQIARFYEDAAGQSQSLVGDVPRVFRLMVKGREERIEKLESLLKSAVEAR